MKYRDEITYYKPVTIELPNGKYQRVQRYRVPGMIKPKKKTVTMSKKTALAERKADEKIKEKIYKALDVANLTNPMITASELADRFLEAYKQQGKTYNTNASKAFMLKYFKNYFKDKPFITITTVQLNKYFNHLLYVENKSNNTVSKAKSNTNQLFNYAFKLGYIDNNPAKDVMIDYKDESNKKNERIENFYLTDAELVKILNKCKEKGREDYHDLFYWLYLTGLRIGEGSALKVKDIFQDKKTGFYYADINGTLIKRTGKKAEKQPKTKTPAGMRKIVLPQEAVDIFMRRKVGKKNDDFIFTNRITGSPMDRTTVGPFLRRLCKTCAISKHVTTHIFRHTHVSKLSEENYPLELISKRVGHEDSEITRKIYQHITENAQSKFDEQMQYFNFVPKLSQNENNPAKNHR